MSDHDQAGTAPDKLQPVHLEIPGVDGRLRKVATQPLNRAPGKKPGFFARLRAMLDRHHDSKLNTGFNRVTDHNASHATTGTLSFISALDGNPLSAVSALVHGIELALPSHHGHGHDHGKEHGHKRQHGHEHKDRKQAGHGTRPAHEKSAHIRSSRKARRGHVEEMPDPLENGEGEGPSTLKIQKLNGKGPGLGRRILNALRMGPKTTDKVRNMAHKAHQVLDSDASHGLQAGMYSTLALTYGSKVVLGSLLTGNVPLAAATGVALLGVYGVMAFKHTKTFVRRMVNRIAGRPPAGVETAGTGNGQPATGQPEPAGALPASSPSTKPSPVKPVQGVTFTTRAGDLMKAAAPAEGPSPALPSRTTLSSAAPSRPSRGGPKP